jgi:membrane dipeptidase
MRTRHFSSFTTPPDDNPDFAPLGPIADEWAAHVAHVIRTVGPDHVGIGLDLVAAHSPSVMRNASGYPDLIAALRRVTDGDIVRKVAGENWLRVLDAVLD